MEISNILFEYSSAFLLIPIFIACELLCKQSDSILYYANLSFIKSSKFNYYIILKYSSILLLITTIASPVYINRDSPNNRVGKDIVLAIDSSGSMIEKFDNENSSKFNKLKDIVKDFIKKREHDNIGVVVFGDFAFISSPITYSKDMVIEFLDYLKVGVAGQNTAIGDAIEMSTESFRKSKAKSKVVILISDGSSNAGKISIKNALENAIKKDIKIYTIAIGNDTQKSLEVIAKKSKAESFMASSSKDLESIYSKINELESSNIRSKNYSYKIYLFQYTLFISLTLLLIYYLIEFRLIKR